MDWWILSHLQPLNQGVFVFINIYCDTVISYKHNAGTFTLNSKLDVHNGTFYPQNDLLVLTLTVNTVGNPAQFLICCVYFQNKWKNNIFIDFLRFHRPIIDFPSFPSFLPFHHSQLPTTRDRSIYLPHFILNSCRYCCIWKGTSKY